MFFLCFPRVAFPFMCTDIRSEILVAQSARYRGDFQEITMPIKSYRTRPPSKSKAARDWPTGTVECSADAAGASWPRAFPEVFAGQLNVCHETATHPETKGVPRTTWIAASARIAASFPR